MRYEKDEGMKTVNDSDLIVGYEGKTYSINELKEKAKTFEYGKNLDIKSQFEEVYNNPSEENLEGEVWVRLSQKGWTNYIVSNKARVLWQNGSDKPILLRQVDEIYKGAPHTGYLVFDPKQLPGQIQHGFHVWRLVAMGFLGLQKFDSRIVHHIDNNGYDCRPENLILVNTSQHAVIHESKFPKKEI